MASREATSASLAFSVWSRRRSSGLLWSVAARSRIVLAGVVTGIPWWVVTSLLGRVRGR
jgi:hypothetical protein